MDLYIWILIMIVTAAAFYTDHTRMIIPNWLTVSGMAAGLILHTVSGGWNGLKYSLTGLCGSLLVMLVIYACKGVEAGDVKLFAAFGAIGGLEISFTGLMYSLIAAAAAGIILLTLRKLQVNRPAGERAGSIQFPFMYAVLPGFIATYFMMEVPI